MGLAIACRNDGDDGAMLKALDQALALEPRNLQALIMKADHFAAAGNDPAASAFYAAAGRAAPPEENLPPELRQEVQRARAMSEQYGRQYTAYIEQRLAAKGYDPSSSSRRFTHSLELLTGRKQLYLQQPQVYYFPELPQIQFYDRGQFPWLDAVEAETDTIRSELREVLKDEQAFTPYVEGEQERPAQDYQGLLKNTDWSAFFLWKNGVEVPENAARCPATLKALAQAPLTAIRGRAPSILFSLLRPGAHIPPHTGYFNARLICHLPLIVPDNCRFRVGNELRTWKEGRAWVFDDTMEHEAWNDSREVRVILLFDIWRPEISEEERLLISAMFEAIRGYGGI